jgi:protein-S-isoprenylcysteine O-methyltransferase Ste14
MARPLYLLVALVCYGAFFASFVYLLGFVAGYPALPTHIDKGLGASPLIAAIIDLGLIALFGVQHSVMARPGFKAWWTRIIPQPIERSVYCLAAAAVLGVLFVFWHPIAATVWNVTQPAARSLLWALFGLGWTIVFISTWLISHFELFGLAQVWRHWRGTDAPDTKLTTPAFYGLVRHPIYSGFLLAFWAAPTMSYGHLLLAAAMTIYVLIAIGHEERDLVGVFGDDYVDYRKRVGKLVPGLGKRS